MSDPHFDDVVLLSHFDGTDGDTSYTPTVGNAFTFHGGAELDDAQKKWGATSLGLDGAAKYVTTPGDYDFLHNLDEDYTIEGWIWIAASHTGMILSTLGGTGSGVEFAVISNNIAFYAYHGFTPSAGYQVNSVLSPNTWHYVSVTHSGGVITIQVDAGTPSPLGGTVPPSTPATVDLHVGRGSIAAYQYFNGYIDDLRITQGVARTISSVPTGAFPDNSGYETRIEVPSPLQAPEVLGAHLFGSSAAPGPLGAGAALAFNDFTGEIEAFDELYSLTITGTPDIIIPISSWQATIQTDRAIYAQAVIPNVDEYVDEITARQGVEEIVLCRQTVAKGVLVQSELARAPLELSTFDRGYVNHTCTISGYGDPYTVPTDPKTRVLTEERSISTTIGGSTRIRCAIDWFLRPGDTANYSGGSIVPAYINYYATNSGDSYMDVGDRG